jgi:hypothetical protein
VKIELSWILPWSIPIAPFELVCFLWSLKNWYSGFWHFRIFRDFQMQLKRLLVILGMTFYHSNQNSRQSFMKRIRYGIVRSLRNLVKNMRFGNSVKMEFTNKLKSWIYSFLEEGKVSWEWNFFAQTCLKRALKADKEKRVCHDSLTRRRHFSIRGVFQKVGGICVDQDKVHKNFEDL